VRVDLGYFCLIGDKEGVMMGHKIWLFGAAVFFLAAAGTVQGADLQAQPVLKNGSCPSGYRTSGNYCVPIKNARFALAKSGSCPSGYRTSGKYCVARKKAKLAIAKDGSCPSGYRTSGNYCIAR
jgi:hypothetical protein